MDSDEKLTVLKRITYSHLNSHVAQAALYNVAWEYRHMRDTPLKIKMCLDEEIGRAKQIRELKNPDIKKRKAGLPLPRDIITSRLT